MNRQSGVTVIELGVSYDSLNDQCLQEFGSTLLGEATHANPPRLVIDLTHTEYIGSSFLELLVRAWKRIKQRDGVMALCGAQPFCVEVLQITRLNSLWPVYASTGEAIAALADTNGGGGQGEQSQPSD
ncbi:MAG: STAS domain-containing protein [Planctomycetota bacterium]